VLVASLGPGVTVWLGTWLLGLVCRRRFADGDVEFSFVLVAGTFLALFLLGWRWLLGRGSVGGPAR